MNRPDAKDEPLLDPLVRELLAIDAALEHAPGDTPRNTADATAGHPTDTDFDQDKSSAIAGQCLQWIEAVRVTAPEMLEDVFELPTQEELTLGFGEANSPSSAAFAVAGTHIGRFELIRQLGQGGYGVVFLARDPTLRREVALKVPRPEVLLTPDLRRQFLREAEAAAALDHQHIVSVYDAGSAGPVSYIASAYCPGLSLSRWLQERGQVMSPRLAAEIIAVLAGAVGHAHQRGVLHRDIKPGNILIEHSEQATDESLVDSVRLTDFGLARVMAEPTEESISLGIVGTPAYMAPEQAANRREDIGTGTDVYGLGATLYHLLTGRPPIVGSSQIETLTAILTVEPAEPSHYRGDVPRDLSAICMKALEKETAKRYRSAMELEADLRRFLRGEQVLARPVTQLQRTAKWCRRNPVVAALAAISIVAVFTTLAVSLTGWWTTSRALAREKVALVEADRAYDETKEAIDQYCVEISENQLLNAPGMTPLRKELLGGALEYYTRFVQRHDQDETAVDELRNAHVRIADVHESLGDYPAARAAYQQALLLLDRAASHDDQQILQHKRGMIHRKLSRLCRRLGQNIEALDHAERGLELHRGLLDQGFMPNETRHQIAQLLSSKASVLQRTGQLEEAIALYQDGESLLEFVLQNYATGVANVADDGADGNADGGAADETELHLRLAQLRGNRSIALRELGKLDESQAILEAAAKVYKQLVQDEPKVAQYQENLGKAYANLSVYASMQNELDLALSHLGEATSLFDALATAYPRVTRFEMLRASTRNEAASILNSLGKLQPAEALLTEVVDIFEQVERKTPGVVTQDLAQAQLSLGQILLSKSEIDRAQQLIEAATSALEAKRLTTSHDYHVSLALAMAYVHRVELCYALNEHEEVFTWLDQGLEILESLQQTIPANRKLGDFLAANHACRADVFELQQDLPQAIRYRKLALESSPAQSPTRYQAKYAATLALAGKVDEAVTYVAEAEASLDRQALVWLLVARAHAIIAAAYETSSSDSEQFESHRVRAIELLREGMQAGVLETSSIAMIAKDEFAPLRSLQGFDELKWTIDAAE